MVRMPRDAEGMCVEAWLDTSHSEVSALARIRIDGPGDEDGSGPDGGDGGDGGDKGGGGGGWTRPH